MPLPAVVTIREGGVEPRYPSVPGRMKAKKVEIEERTPSAEPSGPKRVRLLLPPPVPSNVQVLGKGAGGRARRGRPVRGAGGAVPMILVLVEKNLDGSAVEVSLEALTFARNLSAAGGGVPIDAVVVGERDRRAAQGAGGVRRPPRPRTSAATPLGVLAAPAGPPRSCRCASRARSVVVMAAGTDRGNEVMAHVAARAGVAMAANVLSFHGLAPFVVTRQVVGGAALEEMLLDQRPAVFSVAGHAVEAAPADVPGAADVVELTPEVAAADLVARVSPPSSPKPTSRAR